MAEAMQEEVEDLTEVELPETEEEKEAAEEEVVAETQPEDKGETESEIEDYSESVKKRIGKLTFKIRESERREQAAIDYAKSVQDELNKTKNKQRIFFY